MNRDKGAEAALMQSRLVAQKVKMLVMTEERYAQCPVWQGLVRLYALELVAYARCDNSLVRIFPQLETLWYKPEKGVADTEVLKVVGRLHENNPDLDIILCLERADDENMETFLSHGARDIIFIDEFAGDLRPIRASLHRLRQRRRFEAEQAHALALAKQALQSKAESLVWLSHEIRTPMNGVLGMMEILQTTELTADQHELLEVMSRCGQSMIELVSDVLDLSKLEASKMEVRKKSFDPRRLINDGLQLYRREADKRHIKLIAIVAPEVPETVVGDERKLMQILNNLISNAVKYTPVGSVRVSVRLENQDDSSITLKFEIKDTGYGISREQLPRVFAPFEQTDSEAVSLRPGTGIGMSLTKQLVELMGGTIGITSELGKGSTFEVSLNFGIPPFWSNDQAPGIGIARSGPVSKPQRVAEVRRLGSGKHILVVDDDPINLKVARRQLTRLASQVTVASSGVEALELIEKNSFDLIFVDCQMPHMDGSELLQIMRKLPEMSDYVPVIALTALAQDRLHILAEGFDDYLAKPARLEDIVEVLEKWLHYGDRADKDKERARKNPA